MQITAFKAILVRRINIQGCEDYENTFARMESDCTSVRFGGLLFRHCQTLQERARDDASGLAKAFRST